MLNAHDVIDYLAQHELICLDAVIDGDLRISDISRRNRNLEVVTRDSKNYFVKQAATPAAKASLAREAFMYRLLSCDEICHKLRDYIPRYCLYDPKEHLLVLELEDESHNLWEHHNRNRLCSTQLATRMGNALAELHRLTNSMEVSSMLRQQLDNDVPWIFSIHEPTSALLSKMSPANLKVVKVIQQFQYLHESLERMHLTWRKNCLIHFDIKADNWLVLRSSPSGRFTRLKLIDWELAGAGEACWDTGSVFADYLTQWLLSIPMVGGSVDQILGLAGLPLTKIRPAIAAFWKAYVQTMPCRQDADQWLLRSVEYAAVRIMQRSYEMMQMSQDFSPITIYFIQLSQNMLRRPAEAAVRLLRLPLGGLKA